MPKPKPQLFWAVYDSSDIPWLATRADTESQARDEAVKLVFGSLKSEWWKELEQDGFRVARVEVREVVKGEQQQDNVVKYFRAPIGEDQASWERRLRQCRNEMGCDWFVWFNEPRNEVSIGDAITQMSNNCAAQWLASEAQAVTERWLREQLATMQTAAVESWEAIVHTEALRITEGPLAGWWDSCAIAAVVEAGDALMNTGLWERDSGGCGRRQFYRPKTVAARAAGEK